MQHEPLGRLGSIVRQPLGRILIVLLIAGGLYFLWRQAPQQARIVILNAAYHPLQDVELTLGADGQVALERLMELGPGARWEHNLPQAMVRVEKLSFLLADRPYQQAGLGEVYAGGQLVLTVQPDGRLDVTRPSIE